MLHSLPLIWTASLLISVTSSGTICEVVAKVHHINETNMTHVTVFLDRAEITRTLALQLTAAGPFSVRLLDLPETVEPGSVRAEGEGPDLSILDVFDVVASESEATTRVVEDELEQVRSELRSLESNTTRLSFMKSLLEKYAHVRLGVDPSGGGQIASDTVGFDTADDVFDFYANRAQQFDNQREKMNQSKTQLVAKERALLALKDSKLRAAVVDARIGKEPSCLSGLESRQVVLTFRYVVRRASWSPSYDIRVRSGEQRVELLYSGNVVQSTGEDWTNVRLSLSTSDPSRSVSPPLARKRLIHFRRNLAQNSDSSHEPSSEERYFAQRHRSTAALASAAWSVLEVPRAVTMRAQGRDKARKVLVDAYMLTAKFAHYATPTVSPYAYLRATMNNTCPYPLLPSNTIRVFFDGRFVATSELAGIVGVNATFTSFLGVDHSVKIHLDPEIERYQSSLLGGDVTTFSSTARILNRKASPLFILVQNSVAQSTTDKIRVDVLSPPNIVLSQADVDPFSLSPGVSQAHLDNRTGALNWAVCLGPHSEITLPLAFTATTTRGRYIAVTEEGSIQFDRSSDAHMEL